MRNTSPTKSAELELKEEQQLIRQGYEFLDEKRILLAAEILRQLDDFVSLKAAYRIKMQEAASDLRNAVVRHGFDALQLYPQAVLTPANPTITHRLFLGIPLGDAELSLEQTAPEFVPVDPSSEAEACREAFRHLINLAAKLACASGNLHRISTEYRKTEQRARALENVLLPEIQQALKRIGDQLEMGEQEEVVRVRLAGRTRTTSETEPNR